MVDKKEREKEREYVMELWKTSRLEECDHNIRIMTDGRSGGYDTFQWSKNMLPHSRHYWMLFDE